MTIDAKIRIGLLLVTATISVLAALASVHGLAIGFLDEIGGTGP